MLTRMKAKVRVSRAAAEQILADTRAFVARISHPTGDNHQQDNTPTGRVIAALEERRAAGWTQDDFRLGLIHFLKTGNELPITPRPTEMK